MKLSVEQQHILDTIRTGTNVYVDAVAGTGKTTLILSMAKELKDKKILQMTYNKSLKFEVREKIEKENRIDYWLGIGTATISIAILSTIIGYLISDYLNKDMLIGLAIVNPIYFTCMMIGSMKSLQISLSIIFGAILGPSFYLVSPEWCILYGGFISGTLAYFIGEKK